MEKVEEILKRKEETNKCGITRITQLVKIYKVLPSGKEFDVEYVYTSKNANSTFGGESKSFKKLANAEKYVEGIF